MLFFLYSYDQLMEGDVGVPLYSTSLVSYYFQISKKNRMKILAVNSSPRVEGQSKTELMLDNLVEGMRDAGAAVDVVNLREKNIKNCIDCFTCWTKTPGH